MTFRETCDRLALMVAQEALEESNSAQERLDALKVLTGYLSAIQRAKPSDPPPAENGFAAIATIMAQREAPDDDADAGEAGVRAGP